MKACKAGSGMIESCKYVNGTEQGKVLSPSLSGIYLDKLDKMI